MTADILPLAGAALADAVFAFVACVGFALISNPPVRICLVAGVLAGLGLRRDAHLPAQHPLRPALAHTSGAFRLSRPPPHDSRHVRL